MGFSIPYSSFQRSAIAFAGAVLATLLCAPCDSLAHELKAGVTSLRSSDAALLESKRLPIPPRELKRGNAYAPVVWMPEGASVKLGDTDVAFGLARLNPLVRRSFGHSSSHNGAIAAPVMSMQVSPTSSITFIKIMGDSSSAMLAWQLKL